MQSAAQARRQLAERLDEAFTACLDGERDGDAFTAAYDTREDGYELALKAQWAADRDAFIEAELDKVPGGPNGAHACLVAAACRYRLAELDEEMARQSGPVLPSLIAECFPHLSASVKKAA